MRHLQSREAVGLGTFDGRPREIPLGSLPLSFRDAVQLTRSLGEHFLWIDCLCIIQDSEEKWLKESRVMGMIYESALRMIAAVEAASSNDGTLCLHTRTLLATTKKTHMKSHIRCFCSWRDLYQYHQYALIFYTNGVVPESCSLAT